LRLGWLSRHRLSGRPLLFIGAQQTYTHIHSLFEQNVSYRYTGKKFCIAQPCFPHPLAICLDCLPHKYMWPYDNGETHTEPRPSRQIGIFWPSPRLLRQSKLPFHARQLVSVKSKTRLMPNNRTFLAKKETTQLLRLPFVSHILYLFNCRCSQIHMCVYFGGEWGKKILKYSEAARELGNFSFQLFPRKALSYFFRKKYSKYQSVGDQFRFFLHNLHGNSLRQVQLQPRRLLRLRSKYLLVFFFLFFSFVSGMTKAAKRFASFAAIRNCKFERKT